MQHFLFCLVLLMKILEKNANMLANQGLLNQCKRGDPKAQMEIYKLYYKAMYNTSLHIVGIEAEAEDVMQEAFLKAFKLLPSIDLESGFGGWLKKIVINKSLDAVRKRKVYFEDIDEVRIDQADEDYHDDRDENVAEKVGRIKRAMQTLPEKYRVVLSLNLIEGYDHDEISTILGITASTSRAQLSRGKRRLQEMLLN